MSINKKLLKVVIPKGRLYKNVVGLLNDMGLGVETDERQYIPRVEAPCVEAKIMKPQNIPQLVEVGSHDLGFTGLDWIEENRADVEVLLDLGFNPVKIVSAVPEELDEKDLTGKKIVVASEYQGIAKQYLDSRGFDYYFIRTFGATEVFPPDDADMIIDNMSSGRTLVEHKLKIIDPIMESTTRVIANRESMIDPVKRKKIKELLTLMQAVLDARSRVMLEMNVPGSKLDAIVKNLPCMRAPTVAALYDNEGYAVKTAVKKNEILELVPRLKEMGATDILEYEMRKVVI